MLRQLSTILFASVVSTGCVRLNADHCGNQDGDATCAQRGGATVYCNVCFADNDGCVADAPTPECGLGGGSGSGASGNGSSSAGSETGTASTTTNATESTDGISSSEGSSSSSGGPTSFCGDGTVDPNEQCDGGMMTCSELGAGTGVATCTDECIYDLADCSNPSECGDEVIESPEVCEPSIDPEPDCEDVFDGYIGGELGCTENCTYDTSQCISCDGMGTQCTSETCCAGLSCQPALGGILGNTCQAA